MRPEHATWQEICEMVDEWQRVRVWRRRRVVRATVRVMGWVVAVATVCWLWS